MHQISLLLNSKIVAILDRYKNAGLKWKDLDSRDKGMIKHGILKQQSKFCAYCEKKITKSGQNSHIDHIIRQREDITLIFERTNLVASCQSHSSCGHGKEKNKLGTPPQAVLGKDLIHPIFDNPRAYIRFQSSGTSYHAVNILSLSPNDAVKAQTAIIAYGLNEIHLLNMRERAINKYTSTITQIQNLYKQPTLYKQKRAELLTKIQEEEFCSCLKDHIEYELPI